MRRRSWSIALVISVALHGATVGTLAWWARHEPPGVRFHRIPVRLVGGSETRTGSEATALEGPARGDPVEPSGTSRAPIPVRRVEPTAPAAPPSSDVAARSAAAPPLGSRGPHTLAEWWSGRSVVDYVADCRRGDAPPDSILDPRPAPEQVALARTTKQLNDFAWRMRGAWALEKFHERLRENFALMP